jgi:hypothetical protein
MALCEPEDICATKPPEQRVALLRRIVAYFIRLTPQPHS